MPVLNKYCLHLITFILLTIPLRVYPQGNGENTDSWAKVKATGKGNITILWCNIEPFIYFHKNRIIGVEYELMQGFPPFLKERYGVDVHLFWKQQSSFERLYPAIKQSNQQGLFALSYFSITEERKKEVKFTPPYMPDLNILVTSNDLPVYEKDKDFFKDLSRLQGFTMGQSTMQDDINKLLLFAPKARLVTLRDDYEIMDRIATSTKSFGYVPLSIYIVALQKGIKIKRQHILSVNREGFAGIYTRGSDWEEPVNAYFRSDTCKQLINHLIQRHLGAEVADIVLQASAPDSLRSFSSDIELLTKEREIVTERLINTALQVQQERFLKNLIIVTSGIFLIIIFILLNRYAVKRKFTELLQQRNELIVKQKEEIELMNCKLQQKLILSQLNPHLIFNALTAVQHFIMLDDKKTANKYLTQLSRFVRQILQNAEQPTISVEKEKIMVEQFLALEQARFDFKFEFESLIEHDAASVMIPSMLVFPFVEQALYGRVLSSKTSAPKPAIRVHFLHTNHNTIITIRDNITVADDMESAKEITFGQSAYFAEQQISLLNKNRNNKIRITRNRFTAHQGNELLISIPDNILL